MKITTRGRYATRAMLDLALNRGKGPVLLKDVAERQAIPIRYLEQIVSPLVAAGLVRSTRGPRGGVALARQPEDIRLIEIVEVLEGPIAPVGCVGDGEACARSSSCAARDVWSELARAMSGVLEGTTLRDLADRQRKKDTDAGAAYDTTYTSN